MPGSQKWFVPECSVELRRWDEHQLVVYHIPSGETHLLNRVARLAFARLQVKPLAVEELTLCLAESLECTASPSFAGSVVELLQGFDELGLIEPAP